METSLFLVAMTFLLLMLVRIWVWANNQLVGRQQAYNNSRVQAGTAAPSDQPAPLTWVEENAIRGDSRVYTPEELSRDWVFYGK